MKKKYYWFAGIIVFIIVIGIFISTKIECFSASDCEAQCERNNCIMLECVGFWDCINNKCDFKCGNLACSELLKSGCEKSTNSIIVKDFDANKDGKLDSSDTLFELCKNYYGIETDSDCKTKVCGCP